jgi:hypothetical protein
MELFVKWLILTLSVAERLKSRICRRRSLLDGERSGKSEPVDRSLSLHLGNTFQCERMGVMDVNEE